MPRVLVIDDEAQIRRTLAVNLQARGYDVDLAADGASALTVAAKTRPDVVILDLGLPDLDGIEVLHGLRGWSSVPIVVLSARENEQAKVAALDAGADDYVAKPFGIDELLARLRAALRRSAPSPPDEAVVETPDFTIDLAHKTVTRDGEPVHLTSSEYGILTFLAKHPGKAFSRQAILAALWDESPVGDERAIDVHVHNIREKIEADPKEPLYLLTVRGFGYRLTEP